MPFDSGAVRLTPRATTYYGAVGAVLVAFLAIAFGNFGRLFLLNEYRQWSEGSAFYNPLILFSPSTIFNASAFSVAFSRAFTFEVVAAIEAVCGPNAPCHDAFHITLLAASGFLLGALVLQLFPRRPVLFIAGAVLFMLFAQPVFDALAWQATLLDKLALFFSALATYVIARVDVRRSDALYAIVINVLVLLISVAAYNSKEAAFPLVPSLVVLLAIRFATAGGSSWSAAFAAVRKSFIWLAAPALYAIFHVAVVFVDRTFVSASEGQRLTGGHAEFNFFQYVVYMFNLQPLGNLLHLYPYVPEPGLIWFAIVLVAITAVAALLVARIASRLVALTWFWALFSFIVALLIPLRTVGVSPFYLLVPLFYLSILLCATAVCFWDAARHAATKAAVQLIAAVGLTLHVWGLTEPYPSYVHIARMSDNFTAALRLVREGMRASRPRAVVFLWPKTEPLSYMFLGTQGSRSLALYLMPPHTPTAVLARTDAMITDESYDGDTTGRQPPKPGQLIVVLGPSLQLERIASSR